MTPAHDWRAVGLAQRPQGGPGRARRGARPRPSAAPATSGPGPMPISRRWTSRSRARPRCPSPPRRASRSWSACCSASASTGRMPPACASSSRPGWPRRHLTLEEAIRVEGQHEAADQASMANAITSLRFCATHDWSRFVESVSQVEQVLHRDPAGVYGRMDFVEPRPVSPGRRGARRRHRRGPDAGRARERRASAERRGRRGRPSRLPRGLPPGRRGARGDSRRRSRTGRGSASASAAR